MRTKDMPCDTTLIKTGPRATLIFSQAITDGTALSTTRGPDICFFPSWLA
jgi:hypothetical protein